MDFLKKMKVSLSYDLEYPSRILRPKLWSQKIKVQTPLFDARWWATTTPGDEVRETYFRQMSPFSEVDKVALPENNETNWSDGKEIKDN